MAWIKADDKGILAMHDRVLTNNARLSVLHSDLHTWTLHIRDVHRTDRGVYMCQINSDPMLSQVCLLFISLLRGGRSDCLRAVGRKLFKQQIRRVWRKHKTNLIHEEK